MENNKKNIINELFSSKVFVISIVAVASLILLLLSFRLGVFVGFEKAKFSYKWNDNYYNNFGGPRDMKDFREPPFPRGEGMGMMDSRGIFGSIIKIDANSITVKDKDDAEKVIIVDDKTVIKEFKNTMKISDLKNDQKIVVIGEPNSSGQIQARLIRVMPDPNESINGNNK